MFASCSSTIINLMSKNNKKHLPKSMPVDRFERIYRNEIEWETETLLGDGEFKESEYDEAYEQAIDIVAQDKGIVLL